jgi:acetolactate synthase-1/2/3 large subunit
MASCAKQVYLVTKPQELEATIRSAFELARTGRPGPVVVDIPKDVQNWEGKYDGKATLKLARYRERIKFLQQNEVPTDEARRLLEALQQAKRPLIYAGGGVINSNAGEVFTQFCERLNLPVVKALMGIGAIDTTHRLSLHMLGMHGTAYANYAVEDCDFLLTVGARFDDRVAGKPAEFAPKAKFIAHIDIDETEIGKVKAVDWHHVSDAKVALSSILGCQQKERIVVNDYASWRQHLDRLRVTHRMNYDRRGEGIQPQYVLEELNKLTRGKAYVSTGVGQHQMWAAQFFDFAWPRLWLTSGSMGTMGFGLPAAIGAQFAHPDAIVIDVDGDGSIRMNLGEMETCTTYGIPVKILLLNNQGDGMVRQWQKLFFNERFSGSDKSLHKKDFVKSAEADCFGYARCIKKKTEVLAALKGWLEHDGPAFLDVWIDRDAGVYPMVGPGQSYKQMITGPFIETRPVEVEIERDYSKKADLF